MTTLRSLISLTTQLFVQHLVRVYNKENTKAPHKCPCLRRIHLSLVIAGFPLLSISNTHIVYMTWCHYAKWSIHVHGSVNWVMTGSRNVTEVCSYIFRYSIQCHCVNVPMKLVKINPNMSIENAFRRSDSMLNSRSLTYPPPPPPPLTKWLPFHRRYIQMHFRERKVFNFD